MHRWVLVKRIDANKVYRYLNLGLALIFNMVQCYITSMYLGRVSVETLLSHDERLIKLFS